MSQQKDQGDQSLSKEMNGGKFIPKPVAKAGPPKDVSTSGKEVTLESSLLDKDYSHAVHCMIWSKWNDVVLDEFDPHAAILMQVRFDGYLGFPGGMIDEEMAGIALNDAEERCVSAVKRELAEEMNLDFNRHSLTMSDYMFTYRHPSQKLFLHFFVLEIPLDSLREVENMALKAMDFGNEVLGILRIPLYTMNDGYRGFPAFLNNNFIPCSKQQLLQVLEKKNILTKNQIDEALASSRSNRV